MERKITAQQARDRAAPEVIQPEIGLDAAGRAQACARLGKFFLRSADRLELIDLFVHSLSHDFSRDQAEGARTCGCGRQSEILVSVNWSGRVDVGVKFDGWSVALLFCGFLSYKRQWVDYHVTTHHAACSACAKRKGWFDRYERFCRKVPRVLRRGKVQRQPHAPAAAPTSTRGADLRYNITITSAEEISGFKRTLRFQRQTEAPGAAGPTTTVAEATEEIAMGPGWATGHVRRSQDEFHYALRLRGCGNRGFPADNNGDLFVTVTVQD